MSIRSADQSATLRVEFNFVRSADWADKGANVVLHTYMYL